MKTRTLAIAALVVACGKTLPVDAEPAPALDASVVGDGGPVTPPPLPMCPVTQCPSDLRGGDCTEDACSGAFTMTTGAATVEITPGGCVATGTGVLVDTAARSTPRRVAVLAFRLAAVAATSSDRLTIARLVIDTDRDGEKFFVLREDGKLRLCEKNAALSTCTSGVTPAPDVTVHLHGVVSSEDPPRASFALTVGCDPPQVLPVTHPFAPGAVRAVVGCADSNATSCQVTFDDVVLYTADE